MTTPTMSPSSANPLLYGLADLLNTNIYQFRGEHRGLVQRETQLTGFCVLKSQVSICVDENTPKLVTAFVHLRKDLWMYVVITLEGKWLLFFNNSTTKIRPGAEREFGTGNGMDTVRRLGPAITEARMWKDNAWVEIDAKSLLPAVA